jgi:hypothetical protein
VVQVGLALLGLVVAVLLLAQLLLPGIAAQKIREEVGRYGKVEKVTVSASPAIELLWRAAERIHVTASTLRITPSELAGLARKLSRVEHAELVAPSLELVFSAPVQGKMLLHDARLTRQDGVLTASGTLRAQDMHVALPAGLQVEGLEAVEGQPQAVLGGEALAVHVTGHAQLSAQGGDLVAQPTGLPVAGSLTIFSDSAIYLQRISAAPQGEGVRVSIEARPRS